MTGNRVSKAYNHTRRVWKPNLIKVKTEINGTTRTVKICTSCLRSGLVVKKVSVKKADRREAPQGAAS